MVPLLLLMAVVAALSVTASAARAQRIAIDFGRGWRYRVGDDPAGPGIGAVDIAAGFAHARNCTAMVVERQLYHPGGNKNLSPLEVARATKRLSFDYFDSFPDSLKADDGAGVFSHGRPDVSWHPRPPVGAIPPPHKSDDEISADLTPCTLSSEASCKTKLSRNAMLREIKSAGGAASTGADAAGKSVLVRGCDPRMAAKAAGFLPALVGDPEVWESSTDDDDFLAKLDSRAWSVVMFAPGACRHNAANAPIPGANARTQGWSLQQYRALVREVQPEATIVETTAEREVVPKLRAALGSKSDDAEGRRRVKSDDGSRLGHSSLRSHSDLVWPKPQRMEPARCGGADASATRVELHGPVSFDGLAALHDLFARYISASQPGSSLLFRHGSPSSGSAGTDRTAIYAGMHGDVRPVPVALGINESYALAIRANVYGAAINIQAATQVGVLYALESLSQLISFDPATSTYSAPCVDIEDFPRFPHRELMLDSGRFFLPIPLLKQAVDVMAMTKLNVLHLHAVDSESFPLVIKSRPDFAQLAFSPEERYTLPELAELANFSAARGVRLVVEVDLPGHTGYPNGVSPGWCLPYPETCPTPRCRSNNDLNPAVNLTYEIIEDIITELAEALPDTYLHLGGDEVLQDVSPPNTCWQTDPSISKWINASFPGMFTTAKKLGQPPDPRGHGGPLAYMNDRIEAIAKKHGRRSIRWEEAFFYSCCDSPTRADPCPGGFVDGCETSKETIVHHWRAGDSWSGELVKLTSAHGYSSITSAGWYLPGNASELYAIEPCAGVSEAACAAYVLGGGPALWQRDPSALISTAFPNAAVVAEVLWSAAPAAGATRDFAEAEPRLRQFRCALADRGVAAAPVDGPRSFGGCRGNQRALPAKTDDEVWNVVARKTPAENAPFPPMQWHSWGLFTHEGLVTEARMLEMADALVSSGMAAAGYATLNVVCNGWTGRDGRTGVLRENRTTWPSGMKGFAAKVRKPPSWPRSRANFSLS
jgi:hexosaminidase